MKLLFWIVAGLCLYALCACATMQPSKANKVIIMGHGVACCEVQLLNYNSYNLLCGSGVRVVSAANFIVTDEVCER